jgi:hypothetical protein
MTRRGGNAVDNTGESFVDIQWSSPAIRARNLACPAVFMDVDQSVAAEVEPAKCTQQGAYAHFRECLRFAGLWRSLLIIL